MFYDGITRGDAASLVRQHLRGGRVDTPDADARLLMQHVTGLSQLELIARPAMPLTDRQRGELHRLLDRRLSGTPIGRLLQYRDFWGLRFRLSPDTLEPRPDSETLIEAALDRARQRPAPPRRILDLGTGTGCLLIALLSELPAASGLGTDLSASALRTAAENAETNGVIGRASFAESSWAGNIHERFDLIVSNPPYIPSKDIEGLSDEVRFHDPLLALDGGSDGLDAYRVILADLPRLMNPGAVAVLEMGAGQEHDLRRLAAETGLAVVGTRTDLGGHVRAISLNTMPQT